MKYLAAVLAGLLLAAFALLAWQTERSRDLAAQLTTAQGAAIAAGFELSAAKVAEQVITHYVDRVQVVHETAETIVKQVPVYVTPSTDAAYPLPVGFVRVHDAAAAGVPLDGPGAADASRSGVTASAAAAVIADNYGTCHAIAEQLTALQEWVHRVQDQQQAAGGE